MIGQKANLFRKAIKMTYKEAWEKAKALHDGNSCYGGAWIDVVYLLMEKAEDSEKSSEGESASEE